MREREIAHRVFLQELIDSTYVIPGEDQFDPSYLVTPLGAKINRIFWVGGLLDVDHIVEDDKDYYKATLIDPTGQLTIIIGTKYSSAGSKLAEIGAGEIVAVVAKPTVKKDRLRLKVESVVKSDLDTRLIWIDEARIATTKRIEDYRAVVLGARSIEMQAIIEHYGEGQEEKYTAMLEGI